MLVVIALVMFVIVCQIIEILDISIKIDDYVVNTFLVFVNKRIHLNSVLLNNILKFI
jgi:hypothetical protein